MSKWKSLIKMQWRLKQEIDIMYVPLVQAVMPKELEHPSRTAVLREKAPDAKGRYPSDRLSSLLWGSRCLSGMG
jgi:hypothetical protein